MINLSEFPLPPYDLIDDYKVFEFRDAMKYLSECGQKVWGKQFKLEKADKPILLDLLAYAVQDVKICETSNLSLQKGVLLNGPIGCGKTSLLKLFPLFMVSCRRYQVYSSIQIASDFAIDGYAIIEKLGHLKLPIGLDDIGVETMQKHYGTDCNVIGEIILRRYELWQNQGIPTHATSNLNAQELEKKYGNRVRSRMRSMFNLVTFPANTPDKRK